MAKRVSLREFQSHLATRLADAGNRTAAGLLGIQRRDFPQRGPEHLVGEDLHLLRGGAQGDGHQQEGRGEWNERVFHGVVFLPKGENRAHSTEARPICQ